MHRLSIRNVEVFVSKLFYKIAKVAVGELAQSPEVQAKAAKVVEERVVPGVKAGWKKAKPRLQQAQSSVMNATNDVASIAKEIDPRENPKRFISEAAKRLIDQLRR